MKRKKHERAHNDESFFIAEVSTERAVRIDR
jgi:hypothetical protein